MMTLALLLAVSAVAAPPPRGCRTANSALGLADTDNPEDAMVRLVAALVDKRALGAEELQHLVDGAELTDPTKLATGMSDTQKLPFSCVFDSRSAELKDRAAAWERVRAEVRARILPRVVGESQGRETAREGALPVVVAVAQDSLPAEHAPVTSDFPMTSRITWDGKDYVVFGSTRGITLFEPATGLAKVFPMKGKKLLKAPSFFTRNGQAYLAFDDSWSGQIYNLSTKKLETGWMPGDSVFTENVIAFRSGRNQYAALVAKEGAVSGGPDNIGRVIIYNLSEKGKKPREVKINGGSSHPAAYEDGLFALMNGDGKNLVIIDAVKRKVLHEIPVDGYGAAWDNYRPAFFRGTKGLSVVVPAIDHLVVADPRTGALAQPPISVREPMIDRTNFHVFEEGGSPRAAYVSRKNAYVVDLEKGAVVQTFPSAAEPDSQPASFVFEGKRYLTWGCSDGTVMIGDFEHGLVVPNKVADYRIQEIVPFERDGRVMALAFGRNKAVKIVQLAGPPVRGGK